MQRYIHIPFLFFTITAITGVWMRYFSFAPNTIIPYTNILHGHSHLAILGWAFLGVFIVFLYSAWNQITKPKQAVAILLTLTIISLVMFFAFIYQGYGVFSIVMSTLHIIAEYWTALFMYRQLKSQQVTSSSGVLFLKGSFVALFISSLGPYALGVISANGLKDHAVFDMAIYFYLHFQYNGWLYLALIGIFLIVLHKKKIKANDSLARLGFWIYFLALVPGYFTSVLWVDLGEFSIVLAIIGAIGQWIGVLSILLSFMQIREKIKLQYSQFTRWGVWITFLLLFVKSTMELGLTIPQLAALIYDTRSVIIGYLHLTLLGFVSIFIVTLFFMLKILQPNVLSISGFMIFLIGFTLNEMVLFIQAFMDWIYVVSLPYSNHFLLIASSLLLFGILLIWISFLRKTWVVPD